MNPLRLLIFLSLIALLSSCIDRKEAQAYLPTAGQELFQFQKRLNEEKYLEIWNDLTPLNRQFYDFEIVRMNLTSIRIKLGKILESKNIRWKYIRTAIGDELKLYQETEFENGTAEEIIVFSVIDGTLKISSFELNSPTVDLNVKIGV
ncbi:MAG: hypothetical protein MI748_02430 [Opitutales bacterium]|nr:hypothetical protein [Opitutales bacterium]